MQLHKQIAAGLLVILAFTLAFGSFDKGVKHGKKEQQKTIKTEVYKRCLGSDIYNEFQCYNMIIKGE